MRWWIKEIEERRRNKTRREIDVKSTHAFSHRFAENKRCIVWSGSSTPFCRYVFIIFPVVVVRSGKRIDRILCPSSYNFCARSWTCVDLPARSSPSITMNAPRAGGVDGSFHGKGSAGIDAMVVCANCSSEKSSNIDDLCDFVRVQFEL